MTSIECQCTDRFTCGYCLRNAKPWHYTLSSGYAIVGGNAVIPSHLQAQGTTKEAQP